MYLHQAESELARVSEIASNTLRFYQDPKGLSRVGLKGLLDSVVGLFQGRIAVRGVELDLVCRGDAENFASQGELRQVLVTSSETRWMPCPMAAGFGFTAVRSRSRSGKEIRR